MKIYDFDLTLLNEAIKDLQEQNGGDNWWCRPQQGYGDGENAGMGKPITALQQFFGNLSEEYYKQKATSPKVA